MMPKFRKDGFGVNVFQQNETWGYVWVCPYCRNNDVKRDLPTLEEAEEELELVIAEHKESGRCSFDWRAARINKRA